jgi:hypothetical protein
MSVSLRLSNFKMTHIKSEFLAKVAGIEPECLNLMLTLLVLISNDCKKNEKIHEISDTN